MFIKIIFIISMFEIFHNKKNLRSVLSRDRREITRREYGGDSDHLLFLDVGIQVC